MAAVHDEVLEPRQGFRIKQLTAQVWAYWKADTLQPHPELAQPGPTDGMS